MSKLVGRRTLFCSHGLWTSGKTPRSQEPVLFLDDETPRSGFTYAYDALISMYDCSVQHVSCAEKRHCGSKSASAQTWAEKEEPKYVPVWNNWPPPLAAQRESIAGNPDMEALLRKAGTIEWDRLNSALLRPQPGVSFRHRADAGDITCGGQVCGTARYFNPGLEDQTIQLVTLAEGLRGIAALGRLSYKSIARLFARDAAEEGTVVIGKMADLNAEGALAKGERTLDLPNMGSPKANWAQNSSKLREAMSEGKPIRDASAGNPGSNTGFLRAERNVLENHGWTLKDGYWFPPNK